MLLSACSSFTICIRCSIYLFILVIDDLGLLVSLEPHHVLGMKPPAALLKSPRRQVLGPGALHVVENVKQRVVRHLGEELGRVHVAQTRLRVIRRAVRRRLTIHVIARFFTVRQLREVLEGGLDCETHLIVLLFHLEKCLNKSGFRKP